MSEPTADLSGALPLHRGEALTDGIYAVAMTLLVIELKLPDPSQLHTAEAFLHALEALALKAVAWILSFFVLAMFWLGHHASSRRCAAPTAGSPSSTCCSWPAPA